MIEFIHVTREYPKQRGVFDISFKLEKGEWLLLVGTAGAGKSTILRMIYGDEVPDQGEVIVGNHRASNMKQKDIIQLRRMLGVIDQDLTLLKDRTVLKNVMFPGELFGWNRQKNKRLAIRTLNRVGLHDHLDALPHEISAGERRRLGIARALMTNPFALIADEPLGNLDDGTGRGIVELFSKINQQGTSLIMATHRSQLFKDQPVRVKHIEKGRFIRQ
ncbi:ATP-binding cassette domain-containing protein [bacterium]|nr:ATP-binding cassette domain-containing protein [bacterium]